MSKEQEQHQEEQSQNESRQQQAEQEEVGKDDVPRDKKNPVKRRHGASKGRKEQKLKDRIEELEQEKQDLQEKCDRALADYHNLQQRKEEEKKEFTKYSNEKLLQELLPVFDNLKISLQHVSEEDRENAWVKGVEYVVKQFREVLQENGVEEIEAEGKEFDHERMEAVEGKGDKVKKEVKPGYMLNGKVIIPAKVIVEKEGGNSEDSEEDKESEE